MKGIRRDFISMSIRTDDQAFNHSRLFMLKGFGEILPQQPINEPKTPVHCVRGVTHKGMKRDTRVPTNEFIRSVVGFAHLDFDLQWFKFCLDTMIIDPSFYSTISTAFSSTFFLHANSEVAMISVHEAHLFLTNNVNAGVPIANSVWGTNCALIAQNIKQGQIVL